MADRTKIEWADATWNPVTGCTKVSPGCAHCYAESFARRQGVSSSYEPGKGEIRLFPERLEQPLKWKRSRRIFVCSLADLFHKDVPDGFIDEVYTVMSTASQHEYMILTKRADRMEEWHSTLLKRPDKWPFPNVSLGVSVENQHFADLRLPHLIATPAARRFVSYEPALGAVDVRPYLAWLDLVICGGESGPRARPMHADWPRRVRDDCVAAGVAFMFKQWGEWIPGSQIRAAHPSTLGLPCHVGPDGTLSYRVGKRAAGAILDGREWPMGVKEADDGGAMRALVGQVDGSTHDGVSF